MAPSTSQSGESTKICFQFRNTGRCNRGRDCRYSHSTPGPAPTSPTTTTSRGPNQICHYFQNTGNCRYGSRCRYSHESPTGHDITAGPSHLSPQSEERKQIRAASLRFGGMCERREASRSMMQRLQFYNHAVSLLASNDDGVVQETITKVAGDGGLAFIRESIDSVAGARMREEKMRLLDGEISPILEILSHQKACDSAVLEQQMTTLHCYFVGVSGKRMATVFDFVLERLSCTWDLALAERSLVTLAKVVDCNAANVVDERLGSIVSSFDRLLAQHDTTADSFTRFQSLKCIGYLKRRLRIGEAIPSQRAPAGAGFRATFTLAKDLPGELSKDGPRHDNDHQDISKIKILPTMDEISSPREDYLPTTDPSQGHLRGIHWLIDRHFRLLRKDTVGQLTDAVHAEFSRIRGNTASQATSKSAARTLAYSDARIEDVRFDVAKGLELIASIPQPSMVKGLNAKKMEEWWQSSKRLQPGALVCMLDPQGKGSVLFCSVAEYNSQPTVRAQQSGGQTGGAGHSDSESRPSRPWDDKQRAFLPMNLVEPDGHNIGRATRWFWNNGHSRGRVLVEFPGVLLASFEATLATLKDMFQSPKLPFAEILAPQNGGSPSANPPPQYSQRPGFAFDLSSITTDKSQLRFVPGGNVDVRSLERNSSLDHSQAVAVLESLNRSLALVEGPPGTGKSYTGEIIIKILLANRNAARLGPILVVCYTNHALDQLLEHLHEGGVQGIIRIGSRSKSAVLEAVNLRVVAKNAERTKQERDILRDARSAAENARACIDEVTEELRQCDSRAALRGFLELTYHHHYTALFGSRVDEDGFIEVVGRQDALTHWLYSGPQTNDATRPIEVLELADLNAMTRTERASLHSHWRKSIRSELVARLLSAHRSWQTARTQIDGVHREVDRRCLAQAKVIGVTTTGLARNAQLLRKARCKVLLCEEAGEVLEAHLLTALLPSIEHAILIGDHLQLRPQIQNYGLQSTNPDGQRYSLDVSLFERLVEPFMDNDAKVSHSILLAQRRMHPSISRLIRETLYPKLEDAGDVHKYPLVVGMKKRLFWLHHEREEQGKDRHDPTNTSVSNEWEATMTVALVTHLVHQGKYGQGEIAVVVPYLAQLRLLRRLFESRFEVVLNDRDTSDLEEEVAATAAAAAAATNGDPQGSTTEPQPRAAKASLSKTVRLATVDNFQGEEAKVVVISLVRSNPDNRPGFLRIFNRINVLLSRARHGMYIIGNGHTAGSVEMWARVLQILKAEGNYGTALELQCPRHPETPLLVSEPDHFAQFAPDGGCSRPCEQRLSCGHRCLGRCHSDLRHGVFQCVEPCPRQKKGCDHACPRECGQPCEKRCSRLLDRLDIILPCGHRVTSARCWEAQDPSSIACRAATEKTVPGCGHSVKVPCSSSVDSPDYVCRAQCSAVLGCGHVCKLKCHSCRTRDQGKVTKESHAPCRQQCGRNYTTCKHSCRAECHAGSDCGPCKSECDARCSHSKCGKKCYEPCAVCAEGTCASRCPHSQCSMPCAAPCDWIPCSKRCEKGLPCGHKCPSFCGEMCPDAKSCQQCATPEILSSVVDLVELREYREIDLDEEPCLFLACGHIFTASTMDGQMELSSYYNLSPAGQPTAIRSPSEPFSVEQVKVCPHCRGSLRNIARYGRIIRRALLDETTKRFIAWSGIEFAKIASDFLDRLDRFAAAATDVVRSTIGRPGVLAVGGSRLAAVAAIVGWVGHDYFQDVMACRRKIEAYSGRVRREEQPFQRVADFVAHARRQRCDTGRFAFDESVIQVKGQLQSKALLLRCDLFIMTKFMELWRGARERGTEMSFDLSEHKRECAHLIGIAEKSIHPKEIAEGYVFLAQFHALERCVLLGQDGPMAKDRCEVLKNEAERALAMARGAISRHPGSTATVQPEVDAASLMLRDLVFYSDVSTSEMRTVFQAMGFSTGHWYVCVNGHPFVIADCGMPMEQAECNECGAPVGGRNHQAVAGVRRANEMEEIGTGVRGLALGGGQ